MPCRAYTMEYQQAPKPVNACLLESSNAYNNQLAITTNNYSASFAAAAAAAAAVVVLALLINRHIL